MRTDVYFAKKDGILLIAYQNKRQQNVFLQVVYADYAPQLRAHLICDTYYSIEDVIKKYYEYPIIDKQKNKEIGVKYRHIWKPLMQNDIEKELDFSVADAYRAKRELGILVQKLQEILLFVEPSEAGLKSYSHKARELLFLACSDLECNLKKYNFNRNKSMKDYIKLTEYIDLTKYKLSLVGYANPYKCCPFENWNELEPSKSIAWYDAYNQIKHNTDANFHLSTLENCINAIAANIILFAVRYSPRYLYEKDDICSNSIKSSLDYRIENSMDFYIPIFEGERSCTGAFSVPYHFHNGKVIENCYDLGNGIPFDEIDSCMDKE